MAPKFGYWKLRGLAQDIRFLFEYTGEEYEEKIYNLAPNMDRSEWLEEKFNLGLDFPNLPYYIDGDLKLTQSAAILKHIARKHDMLGSTDKEKAILEMVHFQVADMRKAWSALVYGPDFDNNKKTYSEETFPTSAKYLSDFLGDKTWFNGDNITFVDFSIYEILYINTLMMPECLDKHANLKKFLERFQELEPIKKYMDSPNYIKYPINGPRASFGGK